MNIPGVNTLANRSTVRELVAAFASAEADVRAAFASIVEAEGRLNAAFTLGETMGGISVDADRHHGGSDFKSIDKTIGRMARQAWGCIVARLELRRMMSIKRYEDLQKQLAEGELPSITEENVHAFVQGYCASIPQMIGEAVEEVFNWLRPPGSQYKTNTELEIGRRVILTWMVEAGWTPGKFRVNYRRTQHLTALENVFTALDGQGMVSKTNQSALQTAIEASTDGTGRTPYFAFRVHKNHNRHLEILRPDLLARFNQMAGGMRLRPNG
jgi:hypothetical protein